MAVTNIALKVLDELLCAEHAYTYVCPLQVLVLACTAQGLVLQL